MSLDRRAELYESLVQPLVRPESSIKLRFPTIPTLAMPILSMKLTNVVAMICKVFQTFL